MPEESPSDHDLRELPSDQTVSDADWIREGVRAGDGEIAKLQPKWDVPETIAVVADIGHHLRGSGVVDEAVAAIEAGACSVHLHVLDESGSETGDLDVWREVLDGIEAAAPDVVIDGGFRGDTFEEQMRFIREGLFDTASFHPFDDYDYIRAALEVMRGNGVKPRFGVWDTSDILLARNLYVDAGLVEPPTVWAVVPGNPYKGIPMDHPVAMIRGLTYMTELIRDVDEDAVIIVTAAGRPGSYQTGLSTLLGHHLRVGQGETRWRHPHRDEPLSDNETAINDAVTVARGLGREPATPGEYRGLLGI